MVNHTYQGHTTRQSPAFIKFPQQCLVLSDSSNDDYLMLGESENPKAPTVMVTVNNFSVQMLVARGASTDIMHTGMLKEVKKRARYNFSIPKNSSMHI